MYIYIIYRPQTTAHDIQKSSPERKVSLFEGPQDPSIEAMAACWESLEKAVLRLGDEKNTPRKPTSLEGRLGVVR